MPTTANNLLTINGTGLSWIRRLSAKIATREIELQQQQQQEREKEEKQDSETEANIEIREMVHCLGTFDPAAAARASPSAAAAAAAATAAAAAATAAPADDDWQAAEHSSHQLQINQVAMRLRNIGDELDRDVTLASVWRNFQQFVLGDRVGAILFQLLTMVCLEPGQHRRLFRPASGQSHQRIAPPLKRRRLNTV